MPEKSVTEIPRPVRELFEKGKTAMVRHNLDYAIMHFEQVLQKEPAFYECRETLRAIQFKKAGASGGLFKKFMGGVSNQPMLAKGQLALNRDPLEALAIAEQVLSGDPNNTNAHRLIIDAALAADFPRTALLSAEILVKNNPKDRELKLKQAALYGTLDQVAKAEAIYTELLRVTPNDAEVAQAFKNLTARRTMDEGGYDALADGKGSYRDILRDKNEAESLEQVNRSVKTDDVSGRLIEECQARLAKEPKNLKLLRDLAELHAQRKEYDQAMVFYERIRSSDSGTDPSLEKAIADTKLKQLDHILAQLDPNAPDYQERQTKLQAEKFAFQLEECRQRVEKYPTDLHIRFELGVLYFQAGKVSEAIQEFQKAQNNPQRRLQAMGYLAQCFSKRGMNDLAARKFQEALKEKLTFDDEKKDLIYNLGCVYEKMGKREDAIEQLKLIYEIDIGYRDVAAKVDAYYSQQG